MNKYRELVELADAKGYFKFHIGCMENHTINPLSWYLELHLLKVWLLTYHHISVSIETGWEDGFLFEVVLWSNFDDTLMEKTFRNELDALEYGLKAGLNLIK